MIRSVLGSRVSIAGPLGVGRGGAGNGLLNALIAYWPGNEASGDALDLHTNALHLTDVNTVTSNPGLVYPLARRYTAANSEYHRRGGDDALLDTGDVDFTIAAWVYFDTVGNTSKWIANKRSIGAGANGYQLYYGGTDIGAVNRLGFAVVNAGTAGFATATTYGLPPSGAWIFVVGWHDSAGDTVNIQINNGATDSAAFAIGVGVCADSFVIGALATAFTYPMNGRIGPSAFWKSAPGGGGVLSADQRSALYNGGLGLPYASFTT